MPPRCARPVSLVRGAVVGGSGAINGGYFCRGRAADFDGWKLPGWSWDDVLPDFRAIETDHDFTGPLHGADGPIPVVRTRRFGAGTERFVEAALAHGFPWIDDLNGAPGGDGVGALPLNVVDGQRCGPGAMALAPALDRPNLDLQTGTRVVAVRFAGHRVRLSGVGRVRSQAQDAAAVCQVRDQRRVQGRREAGIVARGRDGFDPDHPFLVAARADPVLADVKLIAEPWDVGEGGYQVGNFPVNWAEWNGIYRDDMRAFWKGDGGLASEIGYRLTGSSDLYQNDGRKPYASINFVTAHDGFTMRDLVSYNEKHNDANGEDNNDGDAHNRSWNCGVEGETDDPEVVTLRARQRRNFLATLLISQGVPMISHGDELGRTQGGNNNVYCQDNEISWIDWSAMDDSLVAFTRDLIALRRDHAVFRRRHHFDGRPAARDVEAPLPDIVWLEPDATAKTEDDWGAEARSIGFYLNGHMLTRGDEDGEEPYRDFYVLMNAWWEPVPYTLPGPTFPAEWEVVVDTSSHVAPSGAHPRVRAGDVLEVQARSTVVLRQVPEGA